MKITQKFATKNECYQYGAKLTPSRLMVHSTACKGVMASTFANGWNTYRPSGRQVCVHAFIDDTSCYQLLPWNIQGWHCAGSGNQTAIGIEICEPNDYSDKTYFNKVIQNTIEVYAYLCKTFNISPDKIVSHAEGYKLGIASNHGDPDHWWKHVGYTMSDFRKDVKEYMTTGKVASTDPDGELKNGGVSQTSGNEIGKVTYQVYMRNIGWGNWKADGNMAGTTGQNRRIEALRIAPADKTTTITVHIRGVGDKTYKNITKDTVIGITGEKRRIESVKIESSNTNYIVRVHQKNIGWSSWKTNGEFAGEKGKSAQIEAIEIRAVSMWIKGHIQDKGWGDWQADGEVVGLVGKSKRLEAIQINPLNMKIEAKAHIQGIGWKDYGKITKDTVIGTTGENKRIECLQFKGDFDYRVHIQSKGWSAWTKADGIATMGTVGQALRIEAIEFRVKE